MDLPYSVEDVRLAPLNGVTLVSAYSGCGGLDLGFRLAGFQPLWANDIDRHAAATYSHLLGDHIVVGDIETVDRPTAGAADLVIGGPPCQGFSVAGKMNPRDPRSVHVTRFLDLVERVQPTAFVMENVRALATSPRWADVLEALDERARGPLGYETTLLVLNAADFGVPQQRERMFLVGAPAKLPESVERTVDAPRTVREAFACLPKAGEPGNHTRCSAGITPAKRPVLRPSAYRGSLLFNGNGRHLHPEYPAPTLPASMGGNATPIIDEIELAGGEAWVEGYHRRLLAGEPPTDRAPAQLRRITVEEAAQLQSFPIDTEWCGPTGTRFRQIGNSVPPRMAFVVAKLVERALGIGSVSVEPKAA